MLKVISIDDRGYSIVHLPLGTYEIDGEILSIKNPYKDDIICKNPKNILSLHIARVTVHYINSDLEQMTVSKFEDRKRVLEEAISFCSTPDCLDEEYALKRFIQDWQPIQKLYCHKSEPLPIEEYHSVVDTGNQFITSLFHFGAISKGLFDYHRIEATFDIVKQTFDELGVEYVKDVGHQETANRLVWSKSSHSHLRYVVAFGAFILASSQKWNIKRSFRGTLEECQAKYQADRTELRRIIRLEYAKYFSDKLLSSKVMLKKLVDIHADLLEVATYKRSTGNYKAAMLKITNLIEEVEELLLDNNVDVVATGKGNL